MKSSFVTKMFFFVAMVLLVGMVMLPGLMGAPVAYAQDGGNVDPTATEVPPPTATTVPPTAVPPTEIPPTEIPPTPKPVSIPEPITVVLFGTGLAALSAAVAARRKKDE